MTLFVREERTKLPLSEPFSKNRNAVKIAKVSGAVRSMTMKEGSKRKHGGGVRNSGFWREGFCDGELILRSTEASDFNSPRPF